MVGCKHVFVCVGVCGVCVCACVRVCVCVCVCVRDSFFGHTWNGILLLFFIFPPCRDQASSRLDMNHMSIIIHSFSTAEDLCQLNSRSNALTL